VKDTHTKRARKREHLQTDSAERTMLFLRAPQTIISFQVIYPPFVAEDF
jgi:hypothetical protein